MEKATKENTKEKAAIKLMKVYCFLLILFEIAYVVKLAYDQSK